MELTHDVVAGGLALLGGAILVLNRLGFLTFGKAKCTSCPDPDCKKDVSETHDAVIRLEERQEAFKQSHEETKSKLAGIDTKLDMVVGYVKANGRL